MNILILGGTLFLGRHLVNIARQQGHTVTLFNRGRTNPNLFPQVETVLGDRKDSFDALAGRSWDLLIDTSGYHPTDLLLSTEFFENSVGRYLFISTVSVYADFSQPNIDENAPLLRLDDPDSVALSNESYGPLKSHCEDVVQAVYGDRSLVIRPGLIVGPNDPTDRFTYWPVRAQRGGEILAPQGPMVPLQYIDARDLAAWCFEAGVAGLNGVFNATGPATQQTFGDFLAACRRVAAVDSSLTWVSPEFIEANQIAPFMELPLWVPPDMSGLLTIDCGRAIGAGLNFRPVEETIQATLAWRALLPDCAELKAGLNEVRETELLALWHEQSAKLSTDTH